MKCPFELPVKKIPDSKEFEGLWVVVDKARMIIGFPLKDFEAEYIVQVINCHEILVDACKFAVSPEAPYKTDQLEFANNIIEAIAKKAEQALKEAEKL